MSALRARLARLELGLLLVVHNRLYWPVARRLLRVVDFGDGTRALGWRWSDKVREVS